VTIPTTSSPRIAGQGPQSRGQEETTVAGELVNWVEAGGCDTDLDLVLRGEGYRQPRENQGFSDFGQGQHALRAGDRGRT
jgi:hypothetical protein